MVNFKKKFLSFYKNGNDLNNLSRKELIEKYTNLKKEHEELLAARRNETTAKSFCNWSFVDFYFQMRLQLEVFVTGLLLTFILEMILRKSFMKWLKICLHSQKAISNGCF